MTLNFTTKHFDAIDVSCYKAWDTRLSGWWNDGRIATQSTKAAVWWPLHNKCLLGKISAGRAYFSHLQDQVLHSPILYERLRLLCLTCEATTKQKFWLLGFSLGQQTEQLSDKQDDHSRGSSIISLHETSSKNKMWAPQFRPRSVNENVPEASYFFFVGIHRDDDKRTHTSAAAERKQGRSRSQERVSVRRLYS